MKKLYKKLLKSIRKFNNNKEIKKSVNMLICTFIFSIFTNIAYADNIDNIINMNIIKLIESNNNSKAFNKHSQARGLYQITPILLKDYNIINKTDYKLDDLYNANINYKIAYWYINKRMPALLKHYKMPISTINIIICYNAGIKYVIKGVIPKETKNYINKYNNMLNRG